MSKSFSDFFLGRDPEEVKKTRICPNPNCKAEVTDPDSSYCPRCGFDMSRRTSWVCPSCGEERTSEFCPDCGIERPGKYTKPWKCPGCKRETNSLFCPDCGRKRPPEKEDEPKKEEPKKESKPAEEKKPAEEPKEEPKASAWVCKNPACRERSELPAEFVACPYCGMRRPKPKPVEYTCPTCGKNVSSRYNFCPYCMTKIGGAN